jgi:hypothetical protein
MDTSRRHPRGQELIPENDAILRRCANQACVRIRRCPVKPRTIIEPYEVPERADVAVDAQCSAIE